MRIILLIILFLAIGLAGAYVAGRSVFGEKEGQLVFGIFVACAGFSAALYVSLHPY
jgi:hypothetical protein